LQNEIEFRSVKTNFGEPGGPNESPNGSIHYRRYITMIWLDGEDQRTHWNVGWLCSASNQSGATHFENRPTSAEARALECDVNGAAMCLPKLAVAQKTSAAINFICKKKQKIDGAPSANVSHL